MSDAKDKERQAKIGCLVFVGLALALLIGGGLYLGFREDAEKTPCERYARVYTQRLSNCHSGVTKNHAHHIEICERDVDPSDACLEKIESMTCDQLEAGPAIVAPGVCGKPR
jgi:hypothetical protein